MRTTGTFESDVERLLREEMNRYRKRFKKTLNDAVRQAWMAETKQGKKKRFVVKARPMGNVPDIDRAILSDIDSDLEVERHREVTQKLRDQA